MKRKPDLILPGSAGEPDYMRRWWVWPRNRFFNAYLHKLGSSDDAMAYHDHPWWNVSIILKGSYREHFHDGTNKVRRAGHIVFRSALTLHRLEIIEPVTSLFITGPRVRNWGFLTPDEGWIPHEEWDDYVAVREAKPLSNSQYRAIMDAVTFGTGIVRIDPKQMMTISDILAGYEDPEAEGGFAYPCRNCGKLFAIICDPVDFDPDVHYCGKDQGCCP